MTTPAAAEECILQVHQEETTSLGRPPTLGELFAIVGCARATILLYCARHSLPLTDGRSLAVLMGRWHAAMMKRRATRRGLGNLQDDMRRANKQRRASGEVDDRRLPSKQNDAAFIVPIFGAHPHKTGMPVGAHLVAYWRLEWTRV